MLSRMVTKQSRRDCQEDLEAQAAEPLSFMPNLPAQGKGKRDREAFQVRGGEPRPDASNAGPASLPAASVSLLHIPASTQTCRRIAVTGRK